MDIVELEGKNLQELYTIAKDLNIPSSRSMKKHDLIFKILEIQTQKTGNMFAKGILEILPEGYGFLRTGGYLPSREDIYVSQTQIRRFDMQNGDSVSGQIRPPKEGEKYYSLLKIEAINGTDPEQVRERIPFGISKINRPLISYRNGSARHDCFSSQSRENHHLEEYCQQYY
jgi:transcription termination factor Rho